MIQCCQRFLEKELAIRKISPLIPPHIPAAQSRLAKPWNQQSKIEQQPLDNGRGWTAENFSKYELTSFPTNRLHLTTQCCCEERFLSVAVGEVENVLSKHYSAVSSVLTL